MIKKTKAFAVLLFIAQTFSGCATLEKMYDQGMCADGYIESSDGVCYSGNYHIDGKRYVVFDGTNEGCNGYSPNSQTCGKSVWS